MALYVNRITVVSEPGIVPVPEVQGREDAMGWQLTGRGVDQDSGGPHGRHLVGALPAGPHRAERH